MEQPKKKVVYTEGIGVRKFPLVQLCIFAEYLFGLLPLEIDERGCVTVDKEKVMQMLNVWHVLLWQNQDDYYITKLNGMYLFFFSLYFVLPTSKDNI